MADSFFGFDTSLSNLNDDEIAGEPSEDEYDALNNETFGQDSQEFDWEVEHEQLAEQLESSRRHNSFDDVNMQLEASLSQLVLDEPDSKPRTLGSSVWRHDPPMPTAPTPVQLANVCTVEEVERQLRQKQQTANNQAFFQPRFPPVILQRPPGLQAPVPLPFAPQQQISTNMRDMNQPLSKLLGHNQNQMSQMGQNSILQNHIGQNMNQIGSSLNPMGQNVKQMGQNINQMGQKGNQLGQNVNQMGQNVNQFMQNAKQMNQFQNNQINQTNLMGVSQSLQSQLLQNPIGQSMSQLTQNPMNQITPNQINQNQISQGLQLEQIGQGSSHMGQNMQQNMSHMKHNSQMGQNSNHSQLSQNINHLGQNMNQIGQNHMGQNVNQINQNANPMSQNVNQMGQNINQIGQNISQMRQNINQIGPNPNQMNPNINQAGQNVNQMAQNVIQMSQNANHMGQNMNQMGQNMNQIGQSMNQMSQNMNHMGQNVNQMGQNVNQMGQGVNQMLPNGNQFGPGMNQFSHIMGQPRMMGPPPGINMSRQDFLPNVGPFNQNFRGSAMPTKQAEPMNQINQPLIHQQYQHQLKNQLTNAKPNQSYQNNPKAQVGQPKVDPKTKTRVFNSKTQQNMTSENLVQLIQNTHPMLHMNSSYHNASHHPMLNNRNMFNGQFVTSQLFNQRQNGTYNNSRVAMNGDDSSEGDEYAGLMTAREKQWLINIQMLQLNTGTPYIHDFYYTVFLERQASKEKESVKEAHKANQQNHPFYSGGVKQESHTHTRERHNSNRHNSTSEDAPRTYVPAQFENSLGKLQCGSVTAPRKIIDADVVSADTRPPSRAASRASTANPAEIPRELKRTKQLLLDIEALYLILLRLEELNDPLAISNALILKEREEKQKLLEAAQKELEEQEDEPNLFLKNIESVQRRPKQDSPKSETIDKRQVVNLAVCQKPPVKNLLDENKEELVGKMFSGLLYGDRLSQILTVRKGRLLLSRFLRRVPASHARMRTLWARILRAVPSARRALPHLSSLAPYYTRYIQATTGWSAVLESCSMLVEAFDPARTPYALTSSFTLSCICALVERASSLVSAADATSNERQWSKFLKSLARALKNTTLNVAKPVQPLSETKLLHHLKILESRATIEILQRGRTAAEFADVSKSDVQEQLVKHLC